MSALIQRGEDVPGFPFGTKECVFQPCFLSSHVSSALKYSTGVTIWGGLFSLDIKAFQRYAYFLRSLSYYTTAASVPSCDLFFVLQERNDLRSRHPHRRRIRYVLRCSFPSWMQSNVCLISIFIRFAASFTFVDEATFLSRQRGGKGRTKQAGGSNKRAKGRPPSARFHTPRST